MEGTNDGFIETALPHGELVVFIARGVGLLVAIAAVLFAVLLMMVIRTVIAIVLNRVGVSGAVACVAVLVFTSIKWGGFSHGLFWKILTRSCS